MSQFHNILKRVTILLTKRADASGKYLLTVSNEKPDSASKMASVIARSDSFVERNQWRRYLMIAANMISPSLICLSLARSGAGAEMLPWYLCSVGLSVFSLAQLTSWQDADYMDMLIPSAKVPVRFSETFALSFFAIAILVFVGGLNVRPLPNNPVTQVVDIQFISRSDASDLNSPLPGSADTEEKQPRKRRGDEITLKGVPSPVVPQSSAAPSMPEKAQPAKSAESTHKTSNEKRISEKPPSEKRSEPEKKELVKQINTAPPQPLKKQSTQPVVQPKTVEAPSSEPSLVIPASWSTRKIMSPPVVAMKKNKPDSRQVPYIAEVEPPEMVELIENDGDSDAMQVFQRGGDSTGGKGKENGLSRYLKDLHRRIKNAWTPPKGKSHRLEVLFRLNKNGSLSFARISQSSGLLETDRSAVAAIQGAAKKPQPLPSDYEPEYLEVLYTFNYNVDELREVK